MDKDKRELTLFDFMIMCYHKLVQFLKWLLDVLLKTIRLGLQYFWVVLICAALGFFAGWLLARPIATKYDAYATIYFSEGMEPVISNTLVSFVSSHINIKEQYGVEPEVQLALRKFYFSKYVDYKNDNTVDALKLDGNVDPTDTTLTVINDRLCIHMTMKGNGDFTPWQNAFTAYVHSQPAVVRADSTCKAMANNRLHYFEREVARLDSLATREYCSTHDYGKGGDFIVVKEKNQKVYYEDLDKALKLCDREKMRISNAPDIINFETPFIVNCFNPLWKMAIGFVCGGLMGLLVALFIKYRKNILEYLKQK